MRLVRQSLFGRVVAWWGATMMQCRRHLEMSIDLRCPHQTNNLEAVLTT
jgi:hypothetical protein